MPTIFRRLQQVRIKLVVGGARWQIDSHWAILHEPIDESSPLWRRLLVRLKIRVDWRAVPAIGCVIISEQLSEQLEPTLESPAGGCRQLGLLVENETL